MTDFVQNCIDGLMFGSGYALLALGFTLVFGVMKRLNLSFGPSITEILFALGLEEKVVGVEDYSDYPEAAKLKPKVGDAFNPSLEKIVELDPDLVFTVKQEQLNSELDALGIQFVVLDPEILTVF